MLLGALIPLNLLENFAMKNGKPVVYWDSCIHILLLEGDKSDQELYEGSIYTKEADDPPSGKVYLPKYTSPIDSFTPPDL